MNNSDDIACRLTTEIAARAKLEPEQIKPDAHFVVDLGLSSLDMLAVLAFAEKNFSARFPDEILAELTTLDKAIAAVREYQCKQAESDR